MSPGIRNALIGVAAVILSASGLMGWLWYRAEQAAAEAQARRAEAAFAPALDKLQQAKQQPTDLDATVRVLHGLDAAISSARSLEEWTAALAAADYKGVAPEVLEKRENILQILLKVYSQQVAVEDQEALWQWSSGMLALRALSMVDAQGEVGVGGVDGSFNLDQAQAKRVLQQELDARAETARRLEGLREAEDELLAALLDYAEVRQRYLEEWDRLCTLRDRAYLAAWHGEWPAAQAAADAAILAAPTEREAHLLSALARIEQGPTIEEADQLKAELLAYIEAHPDASAPAFLLLGVLKARTGDTAGARLDLEQAAAYYPRQATALADMLNPYRARVWLRKSQEGGYILELYQSTMLGAGWFSPDLQLARIAFDRGDRAAGQAQVMKHFARRRAQGEWNFLLSDLAFCQDLLGDDYAAIFPESAWLDLLVAPTLLGLGEKRAISVRNRSDKALHNATLILAVHFTEMHPDDYETFVVGKTLPDLPAHQTTDFGEADIRFMQGGVEKTVEDVCENCTRAILVADEAVIWVDTDEFKLAATQSPPAAERSVPLFDEVRRSTTVDVQRRSLLKDDLVLHLPRALAAHRPLFRLRVGETRIAPTEDLLDSAGITLRFGGVAELDPAQPPALRLDIDTALGPFSLELVPVGEGWGVR